MQTSDPSAWTVLRGCRPFAGLSQAALSDIFASLVERTYDAGTFLMRQGDPGDGLLILLEGTASASMREDGHPLAHLSTGDVVGEMALVTREPRTADVLATTPVRALFLPVDAFERLAGRHLELCLVLTNLVADRLGQAERDGLGGKRLDRYRIANCIGRGGMAVVYRARDEESGAEVALKMMSHRLVYEPGALARFRQEAAVLQEVEHENIARLHTLFQAYNTCFLVMEYCDGGDLSRLIAQRGRMKEPEVRRVLGQLATALDHVHVKGLVHRDLKPGNVMLTRVGVVKLTDFGLAVPSVPMNDETRTAAHSVVGTPAFMAPEQLAGVPLDARADVYALGCVAYDMLTGCHFCPATNLLELVRQKLTARLPGASEIGDGISDELYAFLEGALQPEPARRLSSVAALCDWAGPVDLEDAGVAVDLGTGAVASSRTTVTGSSALD